MALIKLSSIVTQISGKIGGQQFGQNAGGHYLKNNGTPRKSITLYQQRQMSVMASSAQSWRQLTPLQRTRFNTASPDYPYLNRVGETKFYSGFAIYTMLTNNVTNLNLDPPPLAQPLPRISFPPTTMFISSSTITTVAVELNPILPAYTYRLYASRPSSVGVSNSYKNQFLIYSERGDSVQASLNISPFLLNRFGPASLRTKVFLSLDIVDPVTGQFLKNIANDSFTYL